MNKSRQEIIASNEVSRMATFSLGGYEQKVLFDGRYKTNPLVIILHGGPGYPLPFSEGSRGMFPELSEHFIMTYWDQLGCGINDRPIDESFRIGDFVDMTVDLVEAVKQEFPDNSINLYATSWGSVLSALAAPRVADKVDNILVYGQEIRDLVFCPMVYESLANSKMPENDKARLEEIRRKPNPNSQDSLLISSWLQNYTEGFRAKQGKGLDMDEIVKAIKESPDYNEKDVVAIYKNGASENKSLLEELVQVDLSSSLNASPIPYTIIQGESDLITPTAMVSQLMSETNNKNLSLEIIKNSSHAPSVEALRAVLRKAIDLF